MKVLDFINSHLALNNGMKKSIKKTNKILEFLEENDIEFLSKLEFAETEMSEEHINKLLA